LGAIPRYGQTDRREPLSNLAALCHDEQNDEEAEQLFNRSLAIWKKMGQLESLGAAATLASLGDICNAEGKYTQAEPLYNHALAIWEKPVNWKTPMRSPLLLG
jgi:tetratricopeptide (TPR) repeat protein